MRRRRLFARWINPAIGLFAVLGGSGLWLFVLMTLALGAKHL